MLIEGTEVSLGVTEPFSPLSELGLGVLWD